MTKITGGCLCGAVRYTVNTKPIVTRACWCNLCQTLASGNATVNLAFPVDAVTITGQLKDYASIADSGHKMHRRFCPDCGTHLFSEAEELPSMIVIRAGSLDDSEQVDIKGIIWTSETPSWALLNPHVPHFKNQPPTPKVNNDVS